LEKSRPSKKDTFVLIM